MIRAHATAVLALLTYGSVFDGKVPDRTLPPYTVFYADSGLATISNLAGASSDRDWQFQTTSVGKTAEQARLFAEQAQAVLLDVVPSVEGRICGRIRHVLTRDAQRDDDVTPPVFYAVDRWRFRSVPA